jgi:uncharacterized protein (TIGR03437 family)
LRNARVLFSGLTLLASLTSASRAQAPQVSNNGVVNGASFDSTIPVAPGSLVSIFGTSLAAKIATADSIPLATSRAEADVQSVTFNNIPAPLLYVSDKQINAQVPANVLPAGVTAGTATLVVNRSTGASTPVNVTVGPFSPAIFTTPGPSGTILGVAINPDGSVAAPVGAIPGGFTHPAKAGDPGQLVIYVDGLGAVTPPVADGHNTVDGLRTDTTVPTVLVGGVPLTPSFAGLSPNFVGLGQINVFLPPSVPTGDAVTLQLEVGGITTSNKVVIAISGP